MAQTLTAEKLLRGSCISVCSSAIPSKGDGSKVGFVTAKMSSTIFQDFPGKSYRKKADMARKSFAILPCRWKIKVIRLVT